MQGTRKPKHAEDVAGDTQTQDGNQSVDSESAWPNGMSWGETTARDEASRMNEGTSVPVSPARDVINIEQVTRDDEANIADPV